MLEIQTEVKPLIVSFELNKYLLTLLYICYNYNISFDSLIALYEQYGKEALFAFKIFACKKTISLSDKDILNILEESKLFYRQILKKNITLNTFSHKYQIFIKWLGTVVEDVYNETISLKLDYTDLYDSLGKFSTKG